VTSTRIERIEFIRLSMPLRTPFRTSFGTQHERDIVIVRVTCDGVEGYGELVAGAQPLYSEEVVGTALVMMREHLVPRVLGRRISHPREIAASWSRFRGNHMAKAAIESAVWDAWARITEQPLAAALGGRKTSVESGVSIGIKDDVPALLDDIEGFLAAGYARIKIKIEPGWDTEVVAAVRGAFGDIALMVDANSAYTRADTDHLRRLDEFGLMMIEQPLAHDDIVDHAALQDALATPICLDESIHTAEDARRALDLGACRIINVKLGRLGGHAESLALHRLCVERGVPVWCGGMLETGVGRLHNIALASLAGFTLPGDTSASERYWAEDIIDPPVTIAPDGTVAVPASAGIGHRIRTDLLDELTVASQTHEADGRASGGQLAQ
jgi:O-succinylbenzoate synthase